MIRLKQTSEAFLHDHPAFTTMEDRIGSGRHILRKTLVAAFRVVVRQELAQGVFHLPLIQEDQPRSAFLLDRADEAFREGIHVGRSRPGFLHQDSRILEDLIVGRRELLVAVADDTSRTFERPGDQVLCHRHQPFLIRMLRHPGNDHLSRPDVDEEKHRQRDLPEKPCRHLEEITLPELRLSFQKVLPRPSSRTRFDAMLLQNLPHPTRTDVHSHEPQLRRDALASPARILPHQLQYQRLLLRRRFFPGNAPAPRRLLAFLCLAPSPQRLRPDDVHRLLPGRRAHRRRRVAQLPTFLRRKAQLLDPCFRQMPFQHCHFQALIRGHRSALASQSDQHSKATFDLLLAHRHRALLPHVTLNLSLSS